MLSVSDIGHCELCGSTRNLEIHHLVPRTACEGILDGDIDDNLLVVCGACHSKLTPRRFLQKYGIQKAQKRRKDLLAFYYGLSDCCCSSDVIDLVESIWVEGDEKCQGKSL